MRRGSPRPAAHCSDDKVQEDNGCRSGNRKPKKVPIHPHKHSLAEHILRMSEKLHGSGQRPDGTHGEVLHERNLEMIEVQRFRTARRHALDERFQFLAGRFSPHEALHV